MCGPTYRVNMSSATMLGRQRSDEQEDAVARQPRPSPPQQHDGETEQPADDVLAHLLERGEPLHGQGRGEDLPPEDRQERQGVDRHEDESDEPDRQAAPQHEGRRHERQRGHGPRRDPQLRRGVERVVDQVQAREVEHVDEVQHACRREPQADEDGEVVVEEAPQRPRHDQDGERHDGEDHLCQGVEEDVRLQAREGDEDEQGSGDREPGHQARLQGHGCVEPLGHCGSPL